MNIENEIAELKKEIAALRNELAAEKQERINQDVWMLDRVNDDAAFTNELRNDFDTVRLKNGLIY